jgi:nucleotide-binding universal stress UspA family protein
MRILLPIDGSSFSDAAVDEVGGRPWPVPTEVKIVTAFQVPITPTPEVWAISDEYYPALEQAAREQAQVVVDRNVARLAGANKSLTVTGEVLAGPAREMILDEAARWQADLIVMGSHGYGAWQRLLLGSVSQAVVSRADCSVEVVHRRRDNNHAKAA